MKKFLKKIKEHFVKHKRLYKDILLGIIIATWSVVCVSYGYFCCRSRQENEPQVSEPILLPKKAPSIVQNGVFTSNNRLLQVGDYYLTIPSDNSTIQINSKTLEGEHGIFETGNFYIYLPSAINPNNLYLPCRQLWINANHVASFSLPTQVNNNITYSFNPGDSLHVVVLSNMNITVVSGSWSYTYVSNSNLFTGNISANLAFMKNINTDLLVERIETAYLPSETGKPYVSPLATQHHDLDYMAQQLGNKVEILTDQICAQANGQWFRTLSIVYYPFCIYQELIVNHYDTYIAWIPHHLMLSNGQAFSNSTLSGKSYKDYGLFNNPLQISSAVQSYEQYLTIQTFPTKLLTWANIAYTPFATVEQTKKNLQFDKFDMAYMYVRSENVVGVPKYLCCMLFFEQDPISAALDIAGHIEYTATLGLTTIPTVSITGKIVNFPSWYEVVYSFVDNSANWFEEMFDLFRSCFRPVFDFMNIKIAPNISIGSLFVLPILAGIIFAVLKIVRG